MSCIGSYEGKPNVLQIVSNYLPILYGVNEVHRRASSKYTPFGWLKDPENQDSTLVDNINALYRHYSAHISGAVIDAGDNLPHIFHMCTRIAMAVVCSAMPLGKEQELPELKNIGITGNLAYVMPPIVMALTKERLYQPRNNMLELACSLNEEILGYISQYDENNPPQYETIVPDMAKLYPLEHLLITVFKFTMHELHHNSALSEWENFKSSLS